MPYGVDVSNPPPDAKGAWAAYVQAARVRLGLSKAEMGRKVGVDRGTVHRWETGQTRPDDGALLHRFAEVLGCDYDEVLAAAGLRRDVAAPSAPTLAQDPELEAILHSGLAPRVQQELIAYVFEQRASDEQRRREWVRRLIRAAGGNTA